MRFVDLIGAAAVVAALTACSYNVARVQPGESIADVRQKAGAPTEERTLADGTKAWYYVHGPGGFTTYRVKFQPDGRVIETSQVLTEANIRGALVPGKTSRHDVADELGRPGAVARYNNINEIVWTYRWMNVQQPYLLDVHFNKTTGLVTYYSMYLDQCGRLTMQCF